MSLSPGCIGVRLGKSGKNVLKAVRTPTVREIERAAGYFEGEGSCAKDGKNGTQLALKQKDGWIISWLQERFGGTIKQRTYPRRGYGKMTEHTLWYWQISGARARGFILTIYGLLSPRRQIQARAALGIF